MNVHDVHRGIHPHRRPKRVGRGPGSGHGKTAGRGHKGQKSHNGWRMHPTFQGGAMPLVRRVPKRGFHNRFAPVIAEVNVSQLEQYFQDGDHVTVERLREVGLVDGQFDQVKILGDGTLTKRLTVAAHRFSASAKQKIEQAGGQTQLLAGPKSPDQKPQTST
ncbi:MAG: 50S ribosomal protein L15 [Pirellulaceae bacterium]|nr:MAG: 50S ribosomal protein L15 [Pirellulaceae bacterium]